MHTLNSLSALYKQILFIFFGLLVSVLISMLIVRTDIQGPLLLVLMSAVTIYLIFLFKNPRLGLITLIIYSFLAGFISREIVQVPSIIVELLLIVTCIAAIVKYGSNEWSIAKNSLSFLMLTWFVISFLQVLNPAGGSIEGWMAEIRTIALYPALITLLGFILIRTNKTLNFVIVLFLCLALVACLNGIKQLKIGLSSAEQAFLDSGGARTHLLWGKLRVFSFYDAAQFGCFQAQFVIITVVLAFSNIKLWKRVFLLLLASFFLYGMLISGTRTVLIVIVVGAFSAIALSRNYKILLIGSVFMLLSLGGLKYTHFGNGNYEIYRLRSALNPEDASLNVRLSSQALFGDYLKTMPFGGGLGSTGYAGHKYNSDLYLSTIEPDSLWVKVWAMYGIVGLVFWFSMYMFILGRGCGIVWNIKDDKLRFKLIALLSGAIGVFFCNYSNEIINIMPSSFIIFLSLVMVYQGPLLDDEIQKHKELTN